MVNGTIATSPFKYQVVVTPAEGDAIESNWADVTVLSATQAVEVTEVALSNELSYVTLGETVAIDVKKAINAFGDELEAANLPTIASVVSSDPTIAYVTGTNTIQPRKAGTVTFTVKFAEGLNLKDVTLKVEVKAAQKATSIKAENVKVEANAAYEYEYDVLDQYGEEMRSDVDLVEVVTNAKGEVVEDVPAAFGVEGTYTVTVHLEDTAKEGDLGAKLGAFTVTTIDVADGEVDEFKLTTAKGFEIDVNPDLVGEDDTPINKSTGAIAVEAYIDGVKISDVDSKLDVANENADVDFKLRTSDKSVLVFADDSDEVDATENNTVKGLKAGTATVSLIKVEGDLETVIATYNVEVKNTVKVITTVAFNEGVEAVTVNNTTQEALITAVAEATDLDEKHIEKVEYAAADEVVIVTLKATYGGEEFVLAAVELDDTDADADADADLDVDAVESNDTALVFTASEGLNTDTVDFTIVDGTDGTATVATGNVEANVLTITFADDLDAVATVVDGAVVTFTINGKDYTVTYAADSDTWTAEVVTSTP